MNPLNIKYLSFIWKIWHFIQKHLGPSELDKLLLGSVEMWRKTVPESVRPAAAAVYPLKKGDEHGPETARLSMMLCEYRTPNEDDWLTALLERAGAIRDSQGSDAHEFFLLPHIEIKEHLARLASSLHYACAEHEPFFRRSQVKGLDYAKQMSNQMAERLLDEGYSTNDEIEKATSQVNAGNPTAAIATLDSLKRASWKKLAPTSKSRFHEIYAMALTSLDRFPEAADHFVASGDSNPTDLRSLATKAMGLLNKGEPFAAHSLAREICSKDPQVARAQRVRILSSPESLSVSSLVDSVPNELRDSPEVATALAFRAMQVDEYSIAETLLRQALKRDPHWSALRSLLASSLVAQIQKDLQTAAVGIPVSIPRSRITEARTILDGLIEEHRPNDSPHSRSTDFFNRATVLRFLGDASTSMSDIRQAYSLTPSEPGVAAAHAFNLLEEGQTDASIEIARTCVSMNPNEMKPRLTLVHALMQLKSDEAHSEAAELARDSMDLGNPCDHEVITLAELAISIQVDEKKRTRSTTPIAIPNEDRFSAAIRDYLTAVAHTRRGDTKKAAASAKSAARQSAGLSTIERFMVASLLSELHCFDVAFEIWEEILKPVAIGTGTLMAIQAASVVGSAQAKKFILETCGALRDQGLIDLRLIRREIVTLLSLRESRRAIEISELAMRALPDDTEAVVLAASVAHQCGKAVPKLIDFSRFPAPDIVDAQSGFNISLLLAYHKSWQEALTYAYKLYRSNRDDPHAQMALISVIFNPMLKVDRGDYNNSPGFVRTGDAVTMSIEGRTGSRVVIIEEGQSPSQSHDEFPPNHALAQAVLGKELGSTVTLPASYEKSATIVGIVPKELFVANRCMNLWGENFPAVPFVEAIPISFPTSDTEADAEEVLKNVLPQIRAREGHTRKVESLYSDHPISLGVVAKMLSCGTIRSAMGIMESHDVSLRVSSSDQHSVNGALDRLLNAATIVISGTAVATMLRTRCFEVLEKNLPWRFAVSQATLDEMIELQRELSISSDEGSMSVLSREGKPIIISQGPEAIRDELEYLGKAILSLETRCDVFGGIDLLEVDEELGGFLEYLEPGQAHPIAHAVVNDFLLWSDDLFVDAIPKGRHQLGRVWTQAILSSLQSSGHVSEEECNGIVVRLFLANQEFIALSPGNIAEIFRRCSWDHNSRFSSRVIDRFSDEAFSDTQICIWAAAVFKISLSEPVFLPSIEKTLHALFDAIRKRAKGTDCIHIIRTGIVMFFGVDVSGGEHARSIIDKWDASRGE